MGQYYGIPKDQPAVFDPTSIIQINSATTLVWIGTGKTYLLNNPSNYTVTLPAISTMTIGDSLQFIHNYTSGVVTIAANGTDTLTLSTATLSSYLLNPGCSLILRKLGTGTSWYVDDLIERRTASQGSNDNSPASTAFVINEFNKHRNWIINGNFDFWQRGTTGNALTGTSPYVADRWQSAATGSTAAISQQAFTAGQTSVPGEPKFFYRQAVTSTAGASNYSHLIYKVESVRTLAGKTVTLSFYAKADAVKNIGVEAYQYFGTGGSPSSPVSTPISLVSLSTSFNRYSLTVTIPSISGKTVGTAGNDYLAIFIWLDAGSSYASRASNLGQQSGTFDFAQAQLEEGNVATPFEFRLTQIELAMCQRYCYVAAINDASTQGWAGAVGAPVGPIVVRFPVTMRASPTVSTPTWSLTQASTPSIWVNTPNGVQYSVTGTVGAGTVYVNNSTAIVFDSEL